MLARRVRRHARPQPASVLQLSTVGLTGATAILLTGRGLAQGPACAGPVERGSQIGLYPGGFMALILIIDDDDAIRRTLTRLLERMGHQVVAAEHGEAGLTLWRERGADLVITDICMPGINGLEVIIQFRAFSPDLAILAMSGGAESLGLDLLGTAAQAGAIRVLPKPFTLEELESAVGELLEPQRRVRQA
jgi:CheY-like chemotaxis protein